MMKLKLVATILVLTTFLTPLRSYAAKQVALPDDVEEPTSDGDGRKRYEWEFWWGAGADLASNYIWRGYDQTYDGRMFDPCIQPCVSIGYGMFYLELWGTFSFGGNYHEADITLGFEHKNLRISLYDVYSNFSKCYFGDYETSGHSLTATIDYLLFDRLNLHWATTLAGGYDYTAEGKRAYSSYFEVGYIQPIRDILDIDLRVGASPYTAPYWCVGRDMDFENPAKGFNVTNISLTLSKEFEAGVATIPVSVGYIFNPTTSRHYALIKAGVSF